MLYVLSRDEENRKSAVNDCLSGLYVGDSEPIGLGQLTLSQKIDYTVDGTQKQLPILRETLIPGTKIDFDLTIDTTILKQYDIDDILEALEYFKDVCNQYFIPDLNVRLRIAMPCLSGVDVASFLRRLYIRCAHQMA